jgi:hypothetical protein
MMYNARSTGWSTSQKSTCQKVNLPKKSICQKSQLTKNTNHSILIILCSGWLFGQLTFWRLTISPSIWLGSEQRSKLSKGEGSKLGEPCGEWSKIKITAVWIDQLQALLSSFTRSCVGSIHPKWFQNTGFGTWGRRAIWYVSEEVRWVRGFSDK